MRLSVRQRVGLIEQTLQTRAILAGIKFVALFACRSRPRPLTAAVRGQLHPG